MQNSLLRRRVAVRACFDVLLEYRLVPTSSSTIVLHDVRTSLLTSQPFVMIEYFHSPMISFDFRIRSTIRTTIVSQVISASNLPNMHKHELLNVRMIFQCGEDTRIFYLIEIGQK